VVRQRGGLIVDVDVRVSGIEVKMIVDSYINLLR
jgi:hypothetical protein